MFSTKNWTKFMGATGAILLWASSAHAGPIIASYSGETSGGNVTFTVNFTGAIAAPSALDPINSIIGYIDLDTDQNATTGGFAQWGAPVAGGNSWINFFAFGSTISLGDEFFIDIGSEEFHPGSVDVIDTNSNVSVGTYAIAFGSTSFTVTVPLLDLGGASSVFNYGIIVGDINGPSDRAPEGADPAQTGPSAQAGDTPEPASAILLAIGAGVAAFWCNGRRKGSH